ncbi:hypothetical protein Taro_056847 [Colocasia esculenta]|uniref:Uncharacterized protein n=1 Tax=Colocasia esculenta TaxID=4460 RepID=A0A843XUI1_COLES|nr:hypothetical protein [Colocasia esculenta]
MKREHQGLARSGSVIESKYLFWGRSALETMGEIGRAVRRQGGSGVQKNGGKRAMVGVGPKRKVGDALLEREGGVGRPALKERGENARILNSQGGAQSRGGRGRGETSNCESSEESSSPEGEGLESSGTRARSAGSREIVKWGADAQGMFREESKDPAAACRRQGAMPGERTKGRVEELLVAEELWNDHKKLFFFPFSSAATCTNHSLEVDQR